MEFIIPVDTLQHIVTQMSQVIKIASDDVTSMVLIEVLEDRVKFYGTSDSVYVVMTARDKLKHIWHLVNLLIGH